jgi:hypothetical protein
MTSTTVGDTYLWWLVLININTKYLIMKPIDYNRYATEDRTAKVLEEIQQELPPDQRIENLRSDAGAHFLRMVNEDFGKQKKEIRGNYFRYTDESSFLLQFLEKYNIKYYTFNSPFTNKNRVVDRAMRTIRDMLGEDPSKLIIENEVYDVVGEYNRTPHSAFNYQFTPEEVQNNKDIEAYFIRQNLYKLEDVKNKQIEAGFFTYTPGDILIIHKDKSKLPYTQYTKTRRKFNAIARFVRYFHGNVLCNEAKRSPNGLCYLRSYLN